MVEEVILISVQPILRMINDYRQTLFPYTYNILGSSEDAKDAVQDVVSSFISSSRTGIQDEKNYLIKSVVNHSINIKNRRKKIKYQDTTWLPEPYATEEADTDINLREIISYSLLILLEQLNPKERAVFILKEGFGYSYEEIAEVLSTNVENARKLLSRARTKLSKNAKPSPSTNKLPTEKFLERYVTAMQERNVASLEQILSDDITYTADGGGKVKLLKDKCHGVTEVANLLITVYHKFQTTHSYAETEINHQPALLFYEGSALKACQIFAVSGDRIQQINTIVDPDKLKNLSGGSSAQPPK
jgi:RNA polymerase sigma-70 factor (ECF subfamily)